MYFLLNVNLNWLIFLIKRPPSSCSFILAKRYHEDIIGIAWHPKTEYLFSIASKDNQIMVNKYKIICF